MVKSTSSSSLPFNPPSSSYARDHKSTLFADEMQARLDALADAQALKAEEEINQSETCANMTIQKITATGTIGAVLLALAGSLTLLILFSISNSNCPSLAIDSVMRWENSDTHGVKRITHAICAMQLTTRYWLLATLGINVCVFLSLLPSLSFGLECCQFQVTARGWRGAVWTSAAVTHIMSTCTLVGWIYTQGLDEYHLAVLHAASVTILFSSLVFAIGIAVTMFIHHDLFATVANDKISRSRRNSIDLEAARSAVASTISNSRGGGHSPHSATNQHSTNSQIRGRFATQASPPPLHSNVAQYVTHGMSLTEIKQIATQIVPCCTPATMVDSITGEIITLPCCDRAPVLPTLVLPVGFTSPRIRDHGPVADLTDASGAGLVGASPAGSHHGHSASAAAAAMGPSTPMQAQTLFVPKHLHLDTGASPTNASGASTHGDTVDLHHSNTPLGHHAAVGSSLHALLSHGPLAGDAGCELCRDLFQVHQLIKILPHCGCAFHSSCIVPYLKHRRDCPRCHITVLTQEENRHHELSRLQMESPPANERLHTPEYTFHHGVLNGASGSIGVTSSPFVGVPSNDLTLSALSSCGRDSATFEYALDSVKLTPLQAGPQHRHQHQCHQTNTIVHARYQNEQQTNSKPNSPGSTTMPGTVTQTNGNMTLVVVPKDR